jgi:hypothetical protein
VFAGVILTGVVAVPVGLALGALLPRELEAVLVLIGIVGIQVTASSDTMIARLLPFRPSGPYGAGLGAASGRTGPGFGARVFRGIIATES